MRHLKTLAALTLLFVMDVACADGTARAQDKQQAAAAAATPSPTPSGLTLEIDRKNGPVIHQSVPGGSFGGTYPRRRNWRPTAGYRNFNAIQLKNRIEGDGVRFEVSLIMDRFHEEVVLIASYLLREDERIVVRELAEHGVEPYEVRLIRVNPVEPALPSVVSNAQSLVVVGIEPRDTNFLSYKLSLRNLSEKDLTHLEIQNFKDGKPSVTQWPRGERNQPLIKAGGVGHVNVSDGGGGFKSADAFTPTPSHVITIVSAVFSDASYEGDTKSASVFVARWKAERRQLARVVALLQTALDAPTSSAETTSGVSPTESFKALVSSLSTDVDPELIEELKAEFPRLPAESHRFGMELAAHGVRKALLGELQEFERRASKANAAGETGASAPDFHAWLSDTKRRFEEWLSRL